MSIYCEADRDLTPAQILSTLDAHGFEVKAGTEYSTEIYAWVESFTLVANAKSVDSSQFELVPTTLHGLAEFLGY